MKIMIVLGSLQGGGAERVAVLWAKAFVELGHDVVLATNKNRSEEPFVYEVHPDVTMVKCFGFHPEKPTGWKAFMFKYVTLPYKAARKWRGFAETHFALRRAMKQFRPDVVVGVMQYTSTQALMASIGLDIPVVSTEHNSFERPASAPMDKITYFYKFIANRWFPVVTVLTEADKRFIGDKLKNVYVLPNPLALLPVKNEKSDRKKRIVVAGRLDAWRYKGFDVLIKAWCMISYKYKDWQVCIAGESHYDKSSKPYLQKLIAENGIAESCRLVGFQSDMVQYFGESEIFVLSSRYEGFGLVLIEAMSQGCACIAADYKGRQREIIRNDSEGLCVPPDDADALAQALEKMIVDEEYRKAVQKNAPKRAADYMPGKVARLFEAILEETVKKTHANDIERKI